MDSVLNHPHHDLDLAENELLSYCAALAPEDAPENCWQAYSFLEAKREQVQAGCDLGERQGCAELDRLNDMAHQLLSTGNKEDLVATFASLARVEEWRRAHQQQQEQRQAAAAQVQQEPDAVHELFARLDTNGDGRLSLVEFRQGMALLGQELDGATVALVSEALDLHGGGLDEAQFRDVLDAERLVSRSPVAALWRRHPKGSAARAYAGGKGPKPA